MYDKYSLKRQPFILFSVYIYDGHPLFSVVYKIILILELDHVQKLF